jgi:hypothetical protein
MNTATTLTASVQNTTRRFPTWAKVVIAIVGLLVIATVAMFISMSYVPDTLDTSTTMLSANGLFSASYQPELDPIAINQIHEWTVHVEDADGNPVEDAHVHVDGGMPQHGHGLPTAPQVTEYLGNGDYLVEGMKFNMGGWWVMTVDVEADGQSDRATFNMVLD